MRNHFPALADHPIDAISKPILEDWKNAMLTAGKAPATPAAEKKAAAAERKAATASAVKKGETKSGEK